MFKNLQETARFTEVREGVEYIGANHALFNYIREPLRSHGSFLHNPENHFLDFGLQKSALAYQQAIRSLVTFISTHFFVYPEEKFEAGFQFCLYPNFNPDRQGGGTDDELTKYIEFGRLLELELAHTEQTQMEFIAAAKVSLGSEFAVLQAT
ncbi:hypothetical protein Z945_2669 [Sulfitobacter noctilucae]|nr:hypothetical protein Z945_2669 [Sulfitobacter noctilucae]